ncbi:MAG: flavin reductase family protein [Oscillospiraceae bacterium]
MKKIKWPGATLMMPVPPVLVSCGTMEKPNAITIAWTGIINSQPPKTYISIRPERYSYNIIKESGEFVINMPTAKMVREIDYCGCRSGANEDKFKAMKLTAMECEGMSCPQIAQSPIALTCRVTEIVPLGSHHMFLADITGVLVEEELLDSKGRLQVEKAGLMAYAHGQYFELGKKIGSFGFSVEKKKKNLKKRR